MEKWKDVEGFKGYTVSNNGRVKNPKGKLMKQFGKNGYMRISMVDSNGRKRTVGVHRIVATAFIERPADKTSVHHIDGNRGNNMASNLKWVTPKENTAYAIQKGSFNRCLKNLVDFNHREAKRIIVNYYGVEVFMPSISGAARALGVSKNYIHARFRNRKDGVLVKEI